MEQIVPVAQRHQGQKQRCHCGVAGRGAQAPMPAVQRAQQVKHVERDPFEADQLHVAEQVREVVGREGENHTGRERRPAARSGSQDVTGQEIGPQPAGGETEEHGQIVSRKQPPGELHGEEREAIERIQRVEQQADAGRRVEEVGEPGEGVLTQQCGFHPPQVPVVLPRIKAVAGDGVRKVARERQGKRQGQQGVGRQRAHRPMQAVGGSRLPGCPAAAPEEWAALVRCSQRRHAIRLPCPLRAPGGAVLRRGPAAR